MTTFVNGFESFRAHSFREGDYVTQYVYQVFCLPSKRRKAYPRSLQVSIFPQPRSTVALIHLQSKLNLRIRHPHRSNQSPGKIHDRHRPFVLRLQPGYLDRTSGSDRDFYGLADGGLQGSRYPRILQNLESSVRQTRLSPCRCRGRKILVQEED